MSTEIKNVKPRDFFSNGKLSYVVLEIQDDGGLILRNSLKPEMASFTAYLSKLEKGGYVHQPTESEAVAETAKAESKQEKKASTKAKAEKPAVDAPKAPETEPEPTSVVTKSVLLSELVAATHKMPVKRKINVCILPVELRTKSETKTIGEVIDEMVPEEAVTVVEFRAKLKQEMFVTIDDKETAYQIGTVGSVCKLHGVLIFEPDSKKQTGDYIYFPVHPKQFVCTKFVK